MDETRSDKALEAAAVAIPAPIPGNATPPKGALLTSLSIGGGEGTVCGG